MSGASSEFRFWIRSPWAVLSGLFEYKDRRFGGCASSFGRALDQEASFISFVRASGRGEAARLLEGIISPYCGRALPDFMFVPSLLLGS